MIKVLFYAPMNVLGKSAIDALRKQFEHFGQTWTEIGMNAVNAHIPPSSSDEVPIYDGILVEDAPVALRWVLAQVEALQDPVYWTQIY